MHKKTEELIKNLHINFVETVKMLSVSLKALDWLLESDLKVN